jgi:NAD(P)-dependent dehydrogenase (short-subunit alcohol dehydrogenase family)
MELVNTSAIVTGGASGLGEATARLLAAAGVKVVIVDLDDASGRDVAEAINGVYVHADVTQSDQIIGAIAKATALAPLWSVVNCAGIAWAQRTVGKDGRYESAHDLDAYRKVIEVNLLGTFNVCRLAATAMSHNLPDPDGMRGALLNTASVAASEGQIGQAAYASSKGGIVGLTVPLARDLAVVGVRVNTILPGLIDTPIYGEGPESDAFKRQLAGSVLFPKRLGFTSEFASLALEFLKNSYLNAECVRLDAGIRMPPK